jgi:MFS family permease
LSNPSRRADGGGARTSGDDGNRLLVRAIVATQFAPPFMFAGVAVALPSIGQDLGAGAVSLGLVETLFLAGSVSFLLPVGRLADAADKRTIYRLGLLAFGISSLLIASSSSVPLILALRFLQGIAAAAFAAAGPAILAEIVPPDRRGRAFGASLGAIYAGLTLGPIAAGALVELAGWRAVFLAGAAVVLVAFAVIRLLMPSTWRPPAVPIPWADAGLLAAGVVCVAVAGSVPGPVRLPALLAGAALLATFVVRQRRQETPLLDVAALARNAVLRDALLVQALLYVNAFSTVFLLSIFMQVSLGQSARTAGLVLATGTVLMALVSPVAGRLADRFPPAAVSSLGAGAVLASTLMALTLDMASSVAMVAAVLAVQGIGFALFASPNMTLIMNSVPAAASSMAAALAALARSVGMLIGMVATALLLSLTIGNEPVDRDPALFAQTTGNAFRLLAVLAAIAVAGCVPGLRRRR